MIRIVLLSLAFLLLVTGAFAILCIPQMSGISVYWGGSGTWGQNYPGPDDDVYIPAGYILNVDMTVEINNLTCDGTLFGYDGVMIANGDVLIGSSGLIDVPYAGAWDFQIHGDFTVNGTFIANTCTFYGDEDEDGNVTLSQGAGATMYSNFQQSSYAIHLQLLTDIDLQHPGGSKSTVQWCDLRLDGHVLSYTNLISVFVYGNTTDFTSGMADCSLWDVEMHDNIALGGWIELMDSESLVYGSILNNGVFTSGWGLSVSFDINGDFSNSGTFMSGTFGSILLYLSGNLDNQGQYQYVNTYFDGPGSVTSPQMITVGPGSDIRSDWNSSGSYVELLGNLNMNGFSWTISNLKTQDNLIQNVLFFNGTINTQGSQLRMQLCTLNGITIDGDLQILDYVSLGEQSSEINGDLLVTGALTTVVETSSSITIDGDLTVETAGNVAAYNWQTLDIYITGNLNIQGSYSATNTYFTGTILQAIECGLGTAVDGDLRPGQSDLLLLSNLTLSAGRNIVGRSGGYFLDLNGLELAQANLTNGDISYGILRNCTVFGCDLGDVTVLDNLSLGDANNTTLGLFYNNGTITTSDTTPSVLTCFGDIDNSGLIAPASLGELLVKCYGSIYNPGIWNAETELCGNNTRTIDAVELGTSVTVEPGSDVVLTGLNHLPWFTVPEGSSLVIASDGELEMTENTFFTGNVINQGVFNNSRTQFEGSNQFYGLEIDVDDISASLERVRVINTATTAPGMDFSIGEWWRLETTNFRNPGAHSMILHYRDELLNGNIEYALSVFYSADNGNTWQKLPSSLIVRDIANNMITVLESELNGLFTLSSVLYDWDPTGLVISSNGSSVLLEWSPASGAQSYKIYSSTSPDGAFEFLGSTAATSWELTEPDPLTFYRVMASTDNL